MTTSAELIQKDIEDRLSQIAFHFEERCTFCKQLQKYTIVDYNSNSPQNIVLTRLLTRIQVEETAVLSELYHLDDNIKKYFKYHQLSESELKVIEAFKPYRIAANFVNTYKHGTRGRGKQSAKIDFHALIQKQKGKKPGPSDTIIGVSSLITFEDGVYQSMDIIECLIRIWEMFLRYHTEIDVKPFSFRIGAVFALRSGQSIYSGKLDGKVIAYAKTKDEERKQANI